MSKIDGLKKLSSLNGMITIAALDHRGSLKESLHPENPASTTESEISAWKKRLVDLYKNEVSGILIDPLFGKDLVDTTQPCGWMLSMEKTGYRGDKVARETEILEGWDVAHAKLMGASGVKLLLYYDPENRELAHRQRELAEKVAYDCKREGIVFLLEPLSYKIEGDRETEVLRIAREVADIPVDIFKFEYPGSRHGCGEISTIVSQPWVLLSAGLEYEKYKDALLSACQSGASGFAVGRAVWQEFGEHAGADREKYFTDVALPRMRELIAIVNAHGKPLSL